MLHAGPVPVLSTLAAEFCICDNWYSEVPGPTEPNRLFVHGATSQGFVHNVSYSTVPGYKFSNKTVCGRMQDAGHTWGFYHYNLSDDAQYTELSAEPQNSKSYEEEFAKDTAAGTLPNYSFICPDYSTPASSQHAPHDVRYGEFLMADTYEALRANEEVWNKTLLIILYDEHGGFFDHVYPSWVTEVFRFVRSIPRISRAALRYRRPVERDKFLPCEGGGLRNCRARRAALNVGWNIRRDTRAACAARDLGRLRGHVVHRAQRTDRQKHRH